MINDTTAGRWLKRVIWLGILANLAEYVGTGEVTSRSAYRSDEAPPSRRPATATRSPWTT